MAVLPDEQREALWREYMQLISSIPETVGDVTKANIRTAVDDLDTYINSEAANINAALPEPYRTEATQSAKSLLLERLLAYRYREGS